MSKKLINAVHFIGIVATIGFLKIFVEGLTCGIIKVDTPLKDADDVCRYICRG